MEYGIWEMENVKRRSGEGENWSNERMNERMN